MNLNARSARLAHWQSKMLNISGAILWLSGALFLVLHYFGQVQGEFGMETHPFESWSLKAHGLALIPALLAIGGLFVVHMPAGWKDRAQRITGLLLGILVGVLVLSGYLLYYTGNDILREWTSLVHWVLGLSVPMVFVLHRLKRRAKRGVGQ